MELLLQLQSSEIIYLNQWNNQKIRKQITFILYVHYSCSSVEKDKRMQKIGEVTGRLEIFLKWGGGCQNCPQLPLVCIKVKKVSNHNFFLSIRSVSEGYVWEKFSNQRSPLPIACHTYLLKIRIQIQLPRFPVFCLFSCALSYCRIQFSVISQK